MVISTIICFLESSDLLGIESFMILTRSSNLLKIVAGAAEV